MPDTELVNCFQVRIHGEFDVHVAGGSTPWSARGFVTTRWVVAAGVENAVQKAFRSARRELDQWSDVRDGLVSIRMEADEVRRGSWWRWLRGGGRGFAFYEKD
jgi:hypothetical protein